MNIGRNSLALIFSGILVFGFFFSGVFGVLDYIIVKALLFLGFGIFAGILVWIAVKDPENKNHLK